MSTNLGLDPAAINYATERLAKAADCLPLLSAKQRELLLCMMGECYCAGALAESQKVEALVTAALRGKPV